MRRTVYRVADESLLIEARDAWAAEAIEALFAGWYLTPVETHPVAARPAIAIGSAVAPLPIPTGLRGFAVAGGGTCVTDDRASYIDIDGSVVAIGAPGLAAVEIHANGQLPLDAPALTRAVTYGLAAALRQRRRFELHTGALVDPDTGTGLLIAGPSGSGKSTLTVHLASAGWPFLTDDVVVLGRAGGTVTAWPLRRCFAITSQTFAASRFLQARTSLDDMEPQVDAKHQFLPHDLFAAAFRDRCAPGVVCFPELTGERHSRVAHLSAGEVMARLIRMSPWSCYDRATAAEHLATLAALATQVTGFSLRAGRDLLDPEASVALMVAHTREVSARTLI